MNLGCVVMVFMSNATMYKVLLLTDKQICKSLMSCLFVSIKNSLDYSVLLLML